MLAMLVVIAAACAPRDDATAEVSAETRGAMKGYELYEWQDDRQWYFSLLIGTNREKTLEEIQSPDSALQGFEELRLAVVGIPSGQYVTWSPLDTAEFPPENVIESVEQLFEDHGLKLTIVDPSLGRPRRQTVPTASRDAISSDDERIHPHWEG